LLDGNASDEQVAATRRDKWLRENADAIAEYNDLVAKRTVGSLADFLAASPLGGSGLKTRRSKNRGSRPRLRPKL
jgi:Post-segregation antitoxin CcdA.